MEYLSGLFFLFGHADTLFNFLIECFGIDTVHQFIIYRENLYKNIFIAMDKKYKIYVDIAVAFFGILMLISTLDNKD
jgi:hypothetical protein